MKSNEKIIENDEFESILVPEINKNVYREKLIQVFLTINLSYLRYKNKLFTRCCYSVCTMSRYNNLRTSRYREISNYF